MIKLEAETLEGAYSQAAEKLSCSITQLNVEVIQAPSKGLLGFFKKKAIIVASCKVVAEVQAEPKKEAPVENKVAATENKVTPTEKKVAPVEKKTPVAHTKAEPLAKKVTPVDAPKQSQAKAVVKTPKKKVKPARKEPPAHSNMMMPASFVTDQEDDYDGSELYSDEDEEIYVEVETEICDKSHDEIHEQLASGIKPKKSVEKSVDTPFTKTTSPTSRPYSDGQACKPSEVASEIKEKVVQLFSHACFEIDEIKVCEHDDKTILIEFSGKDAALLIGKEGYRYKALSYMLYNWITAVYQLQLRLEIAEFLKNQEEMIAKYLEGVYTNIDRDGKAQTKILDGVLVQIALKDLRAAYPDKYIAIRSTRDGAKFIIINSFNN